MHTTDVWIYLLQKVIAITSKHAINDFRNGMNIVKRHLIIFSFLVLTPLCFSNMGPLITQKDLGTGRTVRSNKTLKDMDFQELQERKIYHKEKGNTDVVIRYLEVMETVGQNPEKIAQAKLELGDTYLDDKQFAKAEKKFEDYLALYQEDSKMDYASYKRTLCCRAQQLDPDRDQTKTQETIELIDMFEKQYNSSPYLAELKEIRIASREKLAQSELYVIKDLTSRKRYNNAHKRIAYVKDNFVSEFPDLVAQLDEFETLLPEEITVVATKEEPEEEDSNVDTKEFSLNAELQKQASLTNDFAEEQREHYTMLDQKDLLADIKKENIPKEIELQQDTEDQETHTT